MIVIYKIKKTFYSFEPQIDMYIMFSKTKIFNGALIMFTLSIRF